MSCANILRGISSGVSKEDPSTEALDRAVRVTHSASAGESTTFYSPTWAFRKAPSAGGTRSKIWVAGRVGNAAGSLLGERWGCHKQHHRCHHQRYRQHQKDTLQSVTSFTSKVAGCTTGSVRPLQRVAMRLTLVASWTH